MEISRSNRTSFVSVLTFILISSSVAVAQAPWPTSSGSAPAATPSDTAGAPSPTPTPIKIESTPTPVPSPAPKGRNSKWLDEQKKSCDRYYTGKIQAGIRRACYVGGVFVDRFLDQPTRVAETGCRLQYGEEPGETFACLIGSKIARELEAGKTGFLTDLQLCSETYPVRTELDTYLLESCLVGVHARALTNPAVKSHFDICKSITPERSFIGPCAVGASLSNTLPNGDSKTAAVPSSSHRVQCEKYFDHLRFHMGYRSCLNARAVSPDSEAAPLSLDDIRGRCDSIVADNGNDHERGACVIGAVLLEMKKKGSATTLFDGCGANQVKYEDRDVLGCLAAGSFLSFGNQNTADRLCREVFRDKKSLARSGCINAVSTLAKPSVKE